MQRIHRFTYVGGLLLILTLLAGACASADEPTAAPAAASESTDSPGAVPAAPAPAGTTAPAPAAAAAPTSAAAPAPAPAAAAAPTSAAAPAPAAAVTGDYMLKQEVPMTMEIKSPAFSDGRKIALKYTCNGENLSPALSWTGAPEGTKSFALVSDDQEVHNGTVVSWVVYSIPAEVTELPKGVPTGDTLESGAKQGASDFDHSGYNGPCPKEGDTFVMQYWKIYALDNEVDIAAGSTKAQLFQAIDGHILAGGILSGKAMPGAAPRMTY